MLGTCCPLPTTYHELLTAYYLLSTCCLLADYLLAVCVVLSAAYHPYHELLTASYLLMKYLRTPNGASSLSRRAGGSAASAPD